MFRMIKSLKQYRNNEKGASAVEYGLLVALIAAVIVVAVLALGGVVKGAFTDTKTGMCSGTSATSC